VQALVGAAWRLLNNHNNLIRTLNLSQFGQFDLLPSAKFEPIRHTLHCSPCLQSSALAFYCWCFHCYGDARQQIHTSDTMNDKLHEFCYYDKFCMSKLHQMEYILEGPKIFSRYLKVQKKQKLQIMHICIGTSARLKDICSCELSNYIFIILKKNYIFSNEHL
jgi:hypothetical protein